MRAQGVEHALGVVEAGAVDAALAGVAHALILRARTAAKTPSRHSSSDSPTRRSLPTVLAVACHHAGSSQFCPQPSSFLPFAGFFIAGLAGLSTGGSGVDR